MADNKMESPVSIPELEGSQKYHVFISHSTEDRDFAEKLTTTLEDMKFKCFMYERDLPPDSTIIQGVVKTIKISRRVIIIVTKAFIESEWSVFEAMEALHKGYNEDRIVLIPVLYNIKVNEIPYYLRNHICLDYKEKEENFWKRLTSALVDDRPSTTLIPAGNVAIGLAWSYFYGYLNFVLPGIVTRSEEYISSKKSQIESETSGIAPGTVHPPSKTTTMLRKMVIIIPSSCYCPTDIEDMAPNFLTFEGHIPYTASRAGNKNRSYKSSVYMVKHPESGEEYLFIAEFATPLLSMYEMVDGGLSGLTAEEKVHQRMLFSDKMEEILAHPGNRKCHNKAILMPFDDETEENKRRFPQVLCEHIKRELQKEKDIQEQIDQMSDGFRQLPTDTINERLHRFKKAEKLKEELHPFLLRMQLASGIDVDDQLVTIFISRTEEERVRKALGDELRNIRQDLRTCHKVVPVDTTMFNITRDDSKVGGGSRIFYQNDAGVQKYVTLGAVFVDCINNNKPYIFTTCHLDDAIGTNFFFTCNGSSVLLGKCVASVVQKNPLMEACLVEVNPDVIEKCSSCLSTSTTESPIAFSGPYCGSLPELLANPREVLKCGGPSRYTRGTMKYYAYDFVDPSDGCMIYGGIVTYPTQGEAFTEQGDSGAMIGLAISQPFYVENWGLRDQANSACRHALPADQPPRRAFAAATVDSLPGDALGVEQASPVEILHGIQSPPVSMSFPSGPEGELEDQNAIGACGRALLNSSSRILNEDEEHLPSYETVPQIAQRQCCPMRNAPEEEVMTHEVISAHCFGIDLPGGDAGGQLQKVSVSFRVNLSIYKLQEKIGAELRLVPLLKGSD